MKALRRLRALARVEVRQLARHKARSALIVTLIALPAAALVAASIVVRSMVQASPASAASIEAAIFLLGSLGFVEAALVVAAAFAVGLRRRQREVGLLAATGAGAGDVVTAILVSAALLSLLGGGLGAVLGIGVAALLHPHLDAWTGRSIGPFELAVPQLVGTVLLGLATAVASAWLPARAAARMPVRLALSGRRPQPIGARKWLSSGSVMVLIGLGLTLIAPHFDGPLSVTANLTGAVLGVLGFGACSPWLLERLARSAGRLPLPWRLAVRDAGRFRSRNGPVVAAILAGVAVSVTASAVLASIAADGGVDEPSNRGPRTLARIALLLSVLVGLAVIAAATALTAVETRADRRTLVAVGATPHFVRCHAAASAAFLALLGCALAVPAGLLPAFGATATVKDLAFVMPWSEILAVMVGLPVLAYLGAWCFARPVPGPLR